MHHWPWGPRFGEQVRAGDVVVLSGPPGAGKTRLAKGICRAGFRRATSPPRLRLALVHPAAPAARRDDIHFDVLTTGC